MALTTILGTAQLAVQRALADHVSLDGAQPTVANFLVVSLRREEFRAAYGADESEIERVRNELDRAAREFVVANGWRVGGTGTLVVNLLVRSIPETCQVQLRTVDHLYRLEVHDDRGIRAVAVRSPRVHLGRAHDGAPAHFIAVHDASKTLSRDHLVFTYADLQLRCHLIGRNETTLRDVAMGSQEVTLHVGDSIACGRVSVVVLEL